MKNKSFILAVLACISLAACGKKTADTVNNGLYNPYGPNNNIVYPGGCVPLSPQIVFNAQGASINDISVLAGNMPSNSNRPGSYGQVSMGTGYGYSPYQTGLLAPGTITMNKTGSQGSLAMTVIAPQYQNYVTTFPGVPASIQGVIQLSSQVLSALQSQSGYLSMPMMGQPYGGIQPYGNYNYGYPNYGMAGCISSVGFQAVGAITPSFYGQPGSAQIYQVLMFLYMNNGSTPTPIVL